jgi:hypothetical protein
LIAGVGLSLSSSRPRSAEAVGLRLLKLRDEAKEEREPRVEPLAASGFTAMGGVALL